MPDVKTIESDVNNTVAKSASIPAEDLQNTPQVPPLIITLATDYTQKLVTIASVWALSHGGGEIVDKLSTPTNGLSTVSVENAAIQISLGVVGIIVSCVWTLGIAYLRKEKMTALLNFIPNGK